MSNNLQTITGLGALPIGNTSPQLLINKRDPTPNDWQNQQIGNIWIFTDFITNVQRVWILVSLANNTAKWILFGGSNGDVQSLTGNSGGAVFPLLGNINVVGDGTSINIVGNPATNTLTVSTVGVGTLNVQTFTTTGTYTPTSGMQYCIIEVIGSGGGGGGVASTMLTQGAAGGGAAGGYAKGVFSAATIGASTAVTIGAAGAGGIGANNGGNGSACSVGAGGALISAGGGNGGSLSGIGAEGYASGGTGNAGANGYINVAGQSGQYGFYGNPGVSGTGGSTLYGAGGIGIGLLATDGMKNGTAGTGYGAGGGGAVNGNNNAAATGGAGTTGIVIITEYL